MQIKYLRIKFYLIKVVISLLKMVNILIIEGTY